MKTVQELLVELKACKAAIDWTNKMTIEEIVEKCHRGDWLLWLADKIGLDIKTIILAGSRCAKTVVHLMTDVSRNAVLIAEKFGLGEATKSELSSAADDAYATYAAASADAAANATAHAAYAAYAAARATYAAASADAAANATAHAAYAAYAAVARALAAQTKNELETANICRETFGKLLIETVNKLLAV